MMQNNINVCKQALIQVFGPIYKILGSVFQIYKIIQKSDFQFYSFKGRFDGWIFVQNM